MTLLFKRIFPVAALLVAGCSAEEKPDKPVVPEANLTVRLTKGAYNGGSVAGTEDDVKKVHAYAFNDSALAMSRESDGDSVMFYLPSGKYDILAFANCPNLPYAPESPEDVWTTRTALLDNDPESPVMSGTAQSVDVTKDFTLDVKLQRYMAKLNWSVKDSIADTFYSDWNFVIQDVYMTNVAGENNLELTATPKSDGLWYNKKNYRFGDADDFLYSGELKYQMAFGDTLKSVKPFYVYPNDTPDPEDRSGWTARSTRMVIRAKLGDYTYYYPVTICPIKRNTSYSVSVVISGPGVTDPESSLKPAYLNVRISIAPWTDNKDIEAVI